MQSSEHFVQYRMYLTYNTYYGRNVSVLFGNGNGTFQSHIMYETAASSYSIVSIDFNNDHCMDVASSVATDFHKDSRFDLEVTNKKSDEMTIFLNIYIYCKDR